MQNNTKKNNIKKNKRVGSKNNLKRTDRFREKEVIDAETLRREPEKIVATIHHIVRIKATDFVAFKASFEQWAKQWE